MSVTLHSNMYYINKTRLKVIRSMAFCKSPFILIPRNFIINKSAHKILESTDNAFDRIQNQIDLKSADVQSKLI